MLNEVTSDGFVERIVNQYLLRSCGSLDAGAAIDRCSKHILVAGGPGVARESAKGKTETSHET